MAKKAESTGLYLRKNGDPEGGGKTLESCSPFSDIMPGYAPQKTVKERTCFSSTLEVNSGACWDYFPLLTPSMVIGNLQGRKGGKYFILCRSEEQL